MIHFGGPYLSTSDVLLLFLLLTCLIFAMNYNPASIPCLLISFARCLLPFIVHFLAPLYSAVLIAYALEVLLQ